MPSVPRLIALALCSILPNAASAHPHIFIDVTLSLQYDSTGRLAVIDEIWTYDDLYSLLVLEETGGSVDGRAAPALQRLDAGWEPLNGGLLNVLAGGTSVALSPPRHVETSVENGRIVSRRRTALTLPVESETPVSVQVHDPTFYVAFTMPSQVTILGRTGCRAVREPGDPTAQTNAYTTALSTALARALAQNGAADLQVNIGKVGADAIKVNCGL